MTQKEVKPYSDSNDSKKEQIEQMFDAISPKYDFLNRILSGGIDIQWRNEVVKMVQAGGTAEMLDIATGTGDLAIAIAKETYGQIIGLDLSEGMLSYGRQKIANKELTNRIEMVQGDAENLPFVDNRFDTITVAFGVRNFENLEKGLKEILRVLKPGGQMLILEFSQPKNKFVAAVYNFYSKHILPRIGGALSKDASAYTYLPDSVKAFPHGEAMLQILNSVGFNQTTDKKLTFGIASIYKGVK